MRDKLLKVLLVLFSFLVFWYPLSYGINDLHLIIKSCCILFIGYFIFKCFSKKKKIKIKEKNYIWIILAFALITRIGISLLLCSKITQVSDFQISFQNAKNLNFNDSYYRIFTHWIFHPYFMHSIFEIFGYNQLVICLFNTIFTAITSILIYFVAAKIFDNKKYGLIASLLYVFWPANILYVVIFTQEHVCALLLVLALYLFLLLEKKNNIFIMIVIGFLLGFSAFYKDFSRAFLITFVIYFIMKFIKEKYEKKEIMKNLMTVFIITISFMITKSALYKLQDSIVGSPVTRNVAPCYLLVGLHSSSDGAYNYNLYNKYTLTLVENNYNYNKTNKEIMHELILDIKNNKNIIAHLDQKAKIIFGGDYGRPMWIEYSLKDHDRIISFIKKYIEPINTFFFVFLTLFMSIGLIYMIRKRNLKIFMIYLAFYGCMLMLILVEAQNRYIYAIQTLMCILAIPGMLEINNILENRKKI